MKIKSITAFCLFGLFLCSCNREEVPEGAVTQDTVLHAGMVSVQTRTWLDSEGSKDNTTKTVYWSDGDRINVNGQVSSPVSVQEGEKVSEADFQLRGVEGPYNVVYPHDIVSDKTYDEAGRITISLPSSQRYDATTFASGAAVMYGYSESENVELHNLCAAVRVNLKGTASICAVSLVSESADAPICGTFRLCPKTGELVPVKGEVSISLEIDEANLSEGTDFYFAIPAGDYPAGLTFCFTEATDRRNMICSWKPGTLVAGNMYSFNNVTYVPGAKDIESAEDWEEFVLALADDGDIDKYLYEDGSVRLGADIEAENLTPVPSEFTYIFNGNGKTITRTNATGALFSTVSGEVKNLTLAGTLTLTDEGAPLVNTLAKGGKITGCTNKMTVTFEAADHAYVGGLVKIMQGGTIEGCTNEGAITVNLDLSSADKNTAVAGIVAQINASTNDVTVKNSLNKGAVTLAPESSGNGMKICGLGGIVGWVRAGGAISLDDCDNEGEVTLSAANISSVTGMAAYAICAGGIIGIGAPHSTSGYVATPDGTNGFDIALSNCDNTGVVYNCGVVHLGVSETGNATKRQTNKRVFTGGLAGSLLGKAADYASLVSCTNTGEVYTYDLTGPSASSQPCYGSVTGGFIGFGGYLDMDDCTVNCTMGNGKRPVMSYGGVIGCAVRPFNLKKSNVFVTGFYQRISNYQGNRAVVAAVPVLFGTSSSNTMNIAPAIEGSTITDCNIGASVKTSDSALSTANGEKTDDCSGSLTTTIFKDSEETQSNLVCGQGYTTVETDVTVTGFNYWDGQ